MCFVDGVNHLLHLR